MTLNDLLSRLERSGSRLDNLELAVRSIRSRLRFWRTTALIAGGLAIVLFFAWRGAYRGWRRCERERGNQSIFFDKFA